MSILVKNVTIGADIETFLFDSELGEIISAEGIIKGTKKKPYRFDKKNKHFATSLDNVMAEFNIPPCTSGKEMHNNIKKCIEYIESITSDTVTCLVTPSAEINPIYLRTKNAQTFG